VPVPIVGVPRKAGPQPLHAGSGRFDDQEIAGNGIIYRARTFKTAPAATLGCAA
jgi:hypothetical protein